MTKQDVFIFFAAVLMAYVLINEFRWVSLEGKVMLMEMKLNERE